jgi:hypothetical protein
MSVAAESLDVIARRSGDTGARGMSMGGIIKTLHILEIAHRHDIQ